MATLESEVMAKMPDNDANALHTMPDGSALKNKFEAEHWVDGHCAGRDKESRKPDELWRIRSHEDIWFAGYDWMYVRIITCEFLERVFDEKKVDAYDKKDHRTIIFAPSVLPIAINYTYTLKTDDK